ncbi:hypothetical protein SAMN05216227_102128 [Pseudorhodobacter antarcticus]|jgi:hypothetical protein|uniref:DUF721 domain-containing protein n=1 Tax=Pseudorhodobacter antarcticus TaxID=1077947 RepID=A0A1H8IQE3_9RHOB|nr:DUF721 domain-containing protein [Pseudorhodobacter antarcticus]SEN70642.1 hypothetical protein SAMN05216227_102128 [Pseudorhodobacter antarcticus]
MKQAQGGTYQAKIRRLRGFEATSNLLKDRIRTAGETRGFAVTRLLTAWAEIVGVEVAAITRPVKIGYGKGGMGAALTLLTTSSNAPMVQMQLPVIKEKVNACYGYAAISRIMLTQTAPTGFAEGQPSFTHAPAPKPAPDPAIKAEAERAAEGVHDNALRDALESLTQNFLSRAKSQRGKL